MSHFIGRRRLGQGVAVFVTGHSRLVGIDSGALRVYQLRPGLGTRYPLLPNSLLREHNLVVLLVFDVIVLVRVVDQVGLVVAV